MQKTCANCGNSFEVTGEDREFLENVSPVIGGQKYAIPPPTFCADCRSMRQLTFRNESTFYRRKCDKTGQPVISLYAPDVPYVIYDHRVWWSDSWDAMDYGRDIDDAKGFFEQFHSLLSTVPLPSLVNNQAENADYCNFADKSKNSYLAVATRNIEDTYYSRVILSTRSVSDVLWCVKGELLYECIDCRDCYNLRYAQECEACADGAFLLHCQGVKNSLFCINLRNCSYHLFNKPCTKEEYEREMARLDGDAVHYAEAVTRFEELKKEYPIRRARNVRSSEQVEGDNIVQSQNIRFSFDIQECRDGAYLQDGLHGNDCQSCCFFDGAELCYESMSLIGYRCLFTLYCRDSTDLLYSAHCLGCTHCFGCVGLRKKSYCIFNKQYSQREYEEMVPRIIDGMRHTDEWGEFFPVTLSPFAYNETTAQVYFPLTPESARQKGYRWKQETDDVPQTKSALPASQMPARIADVSDDILSSTFLCEATGRPFRILRQELNFYRLMKLPLPRLHPSERSRRRMARRNPRTLWQRTCANCGKDIQTTYPPSRPEVIYCEECYLKEVY